MNKSVQIPMENISHFYIFLSVCAKFKMKHWAEASNQSWEIAASEWRPQEIINKG